MKSLEEKNSSSLKKSHREETLTKEIERSCFKNILSNVHFQFCKEFLAVLGQLCTCLTGLERVLERGSQSKPETHKFNQPPCCLCNFLLQRTFLWSEVTTLTPQALLLDPEHQDPEPQCPTPMAFWEAKLLCSIKRIYKIAHGSYHRSVKGIVSTGVIKLHKNSGDNKLTEG